MVLDRAWRLSNRRPERDPARAGLRGDSYLLNGGTFGPVAGDGSGSLYVGTSQGIARIDNASQAAGPADVRIASLYTISDGLAGSEDHRRVQDRAGRLWFSTTEGLSYFTPEAPERIEPPQIRIGGLRLADAAQTVSPAGEQSMAGLELVPGQAQLEVMFFGISFRDW